MKQWVGLLARLVVGGFFAYAGLVKLTDPAGSAFAVKAYQIKGLTGSFGEQVGYALPSIELVLGLALVLGLMTRGAALLISVLLVAYIIGISSVWIRGILIDCGCTGGGGYDPHAADKYPWDIARDVGFLALSVYTVWVGRTRLALDSVLFPKTAIAVVDVEGD